jgi:hypothetical protein
VFHDAEHIDTMGPGDFFGGLSVLAAGGRCIVTSAPVPLLTLTAHYMRTVHESIPSLAEPINGVVAARRH